MRVFDVFAANCRSSPHSAALHLLSANCETRSFTWSELEQLVCYTIAQLESASRPGRLKLGDHVATWVPNGLAWILVDLAAQAMGWVHVALDTRLPEKMALDLAAHSRSQVLVVQQQPSNALECEFKLLLADTLESTPPSDTRIVCSKPGLQSTLSDQLPDRLPAQLLYTSGTIGRPKGVLLSHGNLLSNAQAKLSAVPQFASDVRLNVLPFAHAYARTCELSTWILSGSQLYIADGWETFVTSAPNVQPTLINLVPHLVYRLAELLDQVGADAEPLGKRLRLLQVGGAALRDDVWQRLADRGWPPLQGYGLTETSPVICSNRAGKQQPGSVGPPVENVEVRIDQQGVLWTRGPHVMLGYWQDDDATQSRMSNDWFCTGDLAERLPDGSLRILGREDDQIALSTGYKVSPLELTRRLASDPWLEQIVLVGQDRACLAALVFPRYQSLPGDMAIEELPSKLIERWQALMQDLPKYMQVRRIAVLDQPLTVENGGLNFKGAVRRAFVERHLFRELIEQVYQ